MKNQLLAVCLLCASRLYGQSASALYPVDAVLIQSKESGDQLWLGGFRTEINKNNKQALDLIKRYRGEYSGLMGMSTENPSIISILENIKQFQKKGKNPEQLTLEESVDLYRLAFRAITLIAPLDYSAYSDRPMIPGFIATRNWMMENFELSWFLRALTPIVESEVWQTMSEKSAERRRLADNLFEKGDWTGAGRIYSSILPTLPEVGAVVAPYRKKYGADQLDWGMSLDPLVAKIKEDVCQKQGEILDLYKDRMSAISVQVEDTRGYNSNNRNSLGHQIRLLELCTTIQKDPKRLATSTFPVKALLASLPDEIRTSLAKLQPLFWISAGLPDAATAVTESTVESMKQKLASIELETNRFIANGTIYNDVTYAVLDLGLSLGVLTAEKVREINGSKAALVEAGSFLKYLKTTYAALDRTQQRLRDERDPKWQANRGYAYNKGEGVEQDDAKAVFWWRKAAASENGSGQHSLGWAYEHGRGVARDDVESFKWYSKAAKNGTGSMDDLVKGVFNNLNGTVMELSGAEASLMGEQSPILRNKLLELIGNGNRQFIQIRSFIAKTSLMRNPGFRNKVKESMDGMRETLRKCNQIGFNNLTRTNKLTYLALQKALVHLSSLGN